MSDRRKAHKYLPVFLALVGICMAGISLYLTDHYFAVHFPRSLSMGSFCDISRFWNCDGAAFSRFSNIFSVPTALFGLIFGLIIIAGVFIKNPKVASTNFFLAWLNLVGCVVLFAYSLVFLHGLCPGCTIYYVLSLILVLVFLFFGSHKPKPDLRLLALYGAAVVVMGVGTRLYNEERIKKQDKIFLEWVTQIREEKIYDDSKLDFSYALVKATENFADAPLRITLFSDFQCPFCKILGEEIQKVSTRYQGLLNVRYLFFPLDSECNQSVSTAMHPFACESARLSYCAKDFQRVHDEIYDHQMQLSQQWLKDQSQVLGISDCFSNEETKKAVMALVESTKGFDIEAAPTMLINGRKIAGLMPAKALITLLDAFLRDAQK
jgi:uncharacterized membrane protein